MFCRRPTVEGIASHSVWEIFVIDSIGLIALGVQYEDLARVHFRRNSSLTTEYLKNGPREMTRLEVFSAGQG